MESEQEFHLRDMIKTRQWWQIYVAFSLAASTGLMVVSQLRPMGQAFNIDNNAILTAITLFPLLNGGGRILGGLISDRMGREITITTFFALQSLSSFCLAVVGLNNISFVVLVSLIAFFWGPMFAFFPSLIADYYGKQNATQNYGLTYTAKGWGGLIGGYIVAWVVTSYQSYLISILMSTVFSVIATLLIFPKVLTKPHLKASVVQPQAR